MRSGNTQEYLRSLGIRILYHLKQNGFDAVIAGGFARDLYQGRMPRDIDVYVASSRENNSFYKFITQEKTLESYPKGARFYAGLKDLIEVYEAIRTTNFGGYNIQFIEVDTKDLQKYVFEAFDMCNCSIIFDGKDFIKSPQFEEYEKTNIVKLNDKLDDYQMIYSLRKHFFKVAKLYPDLKYDLGMDLVKFKELCPKIGYEFKIYPNTKIFRELSKGNIYGNDFILERKERFINGGVVQGVPF